MQQAKRSRSFRNLFNSDKEMLSMLSRDIGEVKNLSREEQMQAFRLIRAGDTAAKESFLKSFLPLVQSIAKRFTSPYISFMEFVGAGHLGLVRALEKFDPAKGMFSTYATYYILLEIYDLARSYSGFRYSDGIGKQRKRFSQIKERLTADLRAEPSLREISEELKIPVEEAEKLDTINKGICFEAVLKKILASDFGAVVDGEKDFTGGNPLDNIAGNFVSASEEADQASLADMVREILDELPPRSRLVILLRFGLLDNVSHSQPVIGRILGFSKQRIEQIERAALIRLYRNPRLEAEHALRKAK